MVEIVSLIAAGCNRFAVKENGKLEINVPSDIVCLM
jgi:hypothetical protein